LNKVVLMARREGSRLYLLLVDSGTVGINLLAVTLSGFLCQSDYFAVVDADRQTLDAARLVVRTQATRLRAAVVRAPGGGW